MKSLREFYAFLQEDAQQSDPKTKELTRQTPAAELTKADPKALGNLLRTFKSLLDLQTFCKNKFSFLGAGAARRVYKINNSIVIKFVIQEDAAEQNQKEVKNIKCLGMEYAPAIYDYDSENFWWIIEENVPRQNEEVLFAKMKELLHYQFNSWYELSEFFYFSFDDMIREIMLRKKNKNNETEGRITNFKNVYDDNFDNEWFMTLKNAIQHCDIDASDFHTDNWGIRPSTGQLVLIDLGF
jgi:CRISPR/Cas system CSM-associated protein Csm2 small subunit